MMSQKRSEANYVKCDLCGLDVPQSCIIMEKGGTFPKLVNQEHKKHGLEICSRCFTQLRVTKPSAA